MNIRAEYLGSGHYRSSHVLISQSSARMISIQKKACELHSKIVKLNKLVATPFFNSNNSRTTRF